MEARYLRDFKRGDPQTFKGTSNDPTVVEMWLRSIGTVFRLTNCLEAHRVECAIFMLREDAELWWQATHDIISPKDLQSHGHNSRGLQGSTKGCTFSCENKGVHSIESEGAYCYYLHREFSKLKCFTKSW